MISKLKMSRLSHVALGVFCIGAFTVCAESFSIVDFKAFEKPLTTVIGSARSLGEIEAWLKSQQCVKSVQLAGYLSKSNPPQRDFVVGFKMQDGSTVKKIVNIFDLGNQQFRFHKLRDQ